MLLLGLDAASNRANFGYALGHLTAGRVQIDRTGLLSAPDAIDTLANALITAAHEGRALIAIDAPLGWPDGLREALAKHRAGQPLRIPKDEAFQRATDRHLRQRAHGGHRPLEVGADRIARAAHEALTVLDELRQGSGLPVPLAWHPDFDGCAAIEVYPAATLRARGLPASAYKKVEQAAVRKAIATGLEDEIRGLEERITASADEFDACLCLASATDFVTGRCEPPPGGLAEAARREGWIWCRD